MHSTLPAANYALYGAGITGRALYRKLTSSGGPRPTKIFDSSEDLWGTEFADGLCVSPPSEVQEFDGQVLVSCAGGISLNTFLSAHARRPCDYAKMWAYHWANLVPSWKSSVNEEAITALNSKWADELSRQLFEFILNNPTPDSQAIQELHVSGNYFEPECAPDLENINMLILGGNTGEELEVLSKSPQRPGSIILVEPDVQACEFLKKKTLSLGLENSSVVFAAVGEKPGHGAIHGQGPSRKVDRVEDEVDSETRLQIRTIDSFKLFESKEPSLVTMDIEGDEVPALHGASRTLSSPLVSWAVSVYHKPDDLVQVLNFFEHSPVNFDYFFRFLDYGLADLTFYAIPRRAL